MFLLGRVVQVFTALSNHVDAKVMGSSAKDEIQWPFRRKLFGCAWVCSLLLTVLGLIVGIALAVSFFSKSDPNASSSLLVGLPLATAVCLLLAVGWAREGTLPGTKPGTLTEERMWPLRRKLFACFWIAALWVLAMIVSVAIATAIDQCFRDSRAKDLGVLVMCALIPLGTAAAMLLGAFGAASGRLPGTLPWQPPDPRDRSILDGPG